MTFESLVWASQHDWFITYVQVGQIASDKHIAIVRDLTPYTNNPTERHFTELGELQKWAGY